MTAQRSNICRANITSVNISGSMKERVKIARRLAEKPTTASASNRVIFADNLLDGQCIQIDDIAVRRASGSIFTSVRSQNVRLMGCYTVTPRRGYTHTYTRTQAPYTHTRARIVNPPTNRVIRSAE